MSYSKFLINTFVIGLIFVTSCMFSGNVFAAWYQAQGQALVLNGNKDSARAEATQDAVRQALLFSGASISSTQTLVNGLMSNEAFQMNASGEVKRIEKVNELVQGNVISVTIRADIYPKQQACGVSNANHSLITSKFRIKHPGQLLAGNIQGLNGAMLQELERLFNGRTSNVYLDTVLPFTLDWRSGKTTEQALALGRQHNVQLALFGEIEDTSITSTKHAWYKTGKSNNREFRLRVELVDTINGALLHQAYYSTHATWRYKHHESVSPASVEFWNSDYGMAIHSVLGQLHTEIQDVVACQPSTGRILSVTNNQVSINLGREHGLKVGDNVALYQKSILFDEAGRTYLQYNLHPDKLKVMSVNVDNAIVEPESGGFLGNIQPNDFVTFK